METAGETVSNGTVVVIAIAANIVTIMFSMGGMFVALFKRGINEGRTIEILSNLQSLSTDHEARIRVLETHRGNYDRNDHRI
jgi:hypothetical protein